MHAEEEKLRARIQKAEAELQALLAATDDAVLVLESDGAVRDGNPAAEELFGISVDDLPGSPLAVLIAQPLGLGELTRHGPVSFETTARRQPGETLQVQMALSPIESGGRCSYLAAIRPIEKPAAPAVPPGRKLIEPIQKLTHDLNNLLTTVLGNLSLTLMSPPSDPSNPERLVSAKRTTVRAQNLTQKIQELVSDDSPDTQTPAENPAPAKVPEPVTRAAANDSPAGTTPKPRTPRILILDDEEAICSLVSTALDSMGFDVTEALAVAPALQACEEAVKAGRPYDLVISDLTLPGDISGVDAVSRLRSIDPQIRAIVSTGYSSHPVMCDCTRHGFAAAIAKPYDLRKLGTVVREVLESGRTSIFKNT
jgi:PAS domain S-box-containing protein